MIDSSTAVLWRQADAIMDQLLDLEPAVQQKRLLELNPPGPVRERVEQMLKALDRPGVLDQQRFTGFTVGPEDQPPDLSGHEFGCYRLESLIGRGGMSAVYRAIRVDGAYDAPVALKLLNAALLATDWHERFKREVGFLANLRHPNIAALLDAGVAEDGTPWLVTELIQGQPIDRYCLDQALSISEQVGLMVDLAEAVAFAQKNLIVHRDIKPDNVLVTEQGRVVLLDFGIARALDAESARQTRAMATRAFTPEYAAPEQRSGQVVTTATDVYALGILLYKLLTGTLPMADRHTSARTQLTCRPSRELSASADIDPVERRRRCQVLKGDLDNIVVKALAEEPERRYTNAEQLAKDLRAWLSHRPVSARKPSIRYRFGLFVRRRRALAASLATLVLVTVVGISATLWQARQARMEAAVALAAQARTDAVSAFMMSLFDAADPDVSGLDDPRASELLNRGAMRIEQAFNDQPELRADLFLVLAALHQKLGQNQQSSELITTSDVLGSGTPEQQARGWLIESRNHFDSGQEMNQAVDAARNGLGVLPEAGSSAQRIHLLLALSGALHHVGQSEEALGAALTAKRLLEQDSLPDLDLNLAVLTNVALKQASAGDVEAAMDIAEQAWELAQDGQASPTRLAHLLSGYSSVLYQLRRFNEAADLQRQALALVDRHYPQAHNWRARLLGNLGNRLVSLGAYEEAEQMMREAIAMHETLASEATVRSAAVHNNLGNLLTYIERFDDAIEHLSVAFEFAQREFGPLDWRTMTVQANLGATMSKAGQTERGEELLFGALANRREVLGADDFNHALTKSLLAGHYLQYAQPAKALEWAERALANFDRAGVAESSAVMLALSYKGRALWQLGREIEARRGFDLAIQLADQLADDAGTNYLVVMDASLAFLSETDRDAATALLHHVQQSGELEKTPHRPEARRISAFIDQLSVEQAGQ
jgi:eukaryotic-like serine/threonine-protein kinase